MKKVITMLLTAVLCFSLLVPAFAVADQSESVDFNVAYINFSERLANIGITANTCFEDFVRGFESTSERSLQEYTDALVKAEIALASELGSVLVQNQLHSSYNSISDYGIEPCSVVGAWYDNIGISQPKLPRNASYDKYNILDTVKKGDILQETDGIVAQYTGHIALVQGKYWDTDYKQYYIRTIEAGSAGVVYGVFDDSRYEDRGIYVHYVTNATSTNLSGAISFCQNQLGKGFNWGAVLMGIGSCSTNTSAQSWYCSELVWAAFYNQGINLNGTGIPKNIFMPATLASSSKLARRDIY